MLEQARIAGQGADSMTRPAAPVLKGSGRPRGSLLQRHVHADRRRLGAQRGEMPGECPDEGEIDISLS